MKKLLLTLFAILAFGVMAKAGTATFDFTTESTIKAMNSSVAVPGVSSGTNVNDVTFTMEGINVTGTKGNSTEARIWGTTTAGVYQYRLYTGAKLTISSTSETINKIVVSSNANGNISATGYSGGTWEGSANSIEFAVTGTIQINTIEVTFGEGGSVTPPVDPDPDVPTGPSGSVAFVADGANYSGDASIVTLSGNVPGTTFTAQGICSFDMTKVNSSTSNVTGGQVRWYQGDVITITPMAGITITGITINSVATNSAQDQIVNTSNIGTWSYDNTVATWTGSTTEPLKFGNSKQVRFTSLVVTYVRDEGAKKDAGLSFSSKAVTVKGLTATGFEPTLSKDTSATPSYTSSNTNVATVNEQGVVSLVYYGTTIITASVEETNTYAPGSTSYTLTVEPDGVITVKDALAMIEKGYNGNAQVKGYISKIDELSTSYGNATYWIVDEAGTTSPALEIYRGYSLNGDKFTEEDEIEVGGLVTVEGTILSYNGTPEFTTGSKIISYTPPTTVEPEPAYSVTFKFSGVEDAYKYVTMLDMRNGDIPIEITSNELVWKYDNMFQFNVSPTSVDSPYSVEVTCDQPASSAYQIIGMGADSFTTYIVGGYPAANGYVFNITVTKAETPEVTFNFTGNYQQLMFAVDGEDVELESAQYIYDMSDAIETSAITQFTIVGPEGYDVTVTADVEEIPGTTYQVMSVDQNGRMILNIGVWPGAVGATFTVNVTAEAEEIPADAYVVYYNGEVGANIRLDDWWGATFNATAKNPEGTGMAFEVKSTTGVANASMGFMGMTPEVAGKLHDATLNFDWYAVGSGKWTIRLTGAGKDYDLILNEEDVPSATADIAWNNVTVNIAEKFPALAEAWKENTTENYIFAVILDNGSSDAAIYFDKIYYTNVDESWTAPVAPAPETVPAPQQPEDMMLSFVSEYGSQSYNFGGWGQSTHAEKAEIAGSPVIAMTNFNYLGLVDFNINISDYDYMHVDYWTPNENTPFGFVPISLNPTKDEPIWNAEIVKANEWNSYDVALTFWENVDMTAIEQIKFVANQQGGTTPYGYIANVYFWKEEVAEPKVLTLNITGSDDAWQHVSIYNVEEDEEVVLVENTYSITNYGTGLLLSVSPKEGYEVKVTIGTEGLIENKDYQILSQDMDGVVQYAIGMLKNGFDVVFNVAVEEVAQPTVIYVMGAGDGLSWDTFPGQKFEGENGIVTFNIKNLINFKASTVEATNWDEFNAGAYATGNTSFGNGVANAGGETLKMEPWGENQSVPWKGDYTITMNFNTMEMTAYTTTPKPVDAPVMYVRGSMNGWGTSDAWKFTNESWDATAGTGTYTLECKLAPGQTFKFDDGTWGNYNFGGNGAVAINESVDLVWNGGDLTVSSDFDGKITLNITGFQKANAIFEMEGPVKDPDQFYVIGTLAEGAWNPTVGVKMESNGNGKYTAEKVTLVESEGSTGFAITANLGTDSNDWTSVNALRFGPAQNDAMAVIGENTGLAMGDLSWTFTPGTYTMVFDYTNKTLNIEEYVEPELPEFIDITYDFSSYENIKEYAGLTGTLEQEFAQQGSNRYYIIKKLLNGGIEITGDKGTYTGSLPYNSPYINIVTSSGSMTFRMQVGNTFTISAPEGYTLKNVTFGGTSANYISGPALVAGEPGIIGAATTSSPYTRTWTAPEEGTVNTLTFNLPSGSCIIKTISVVAEKVEETEPALNTLVFEDWTMEVSPKMTAPATAEVAVSLDVETPFTYQGFQFDIKLPTGLELTDPLTLNPALNGNVNFSCIDKNNNIYRVIAHSDWIEGGYDLIEDLVTLTVATTYPSEDGLATLISAGDYDVTITNIDFSSITGDDIDNFNNFQGTVTIEMSEISATAIEFESVTLMKPSYTDPSVDPVTTVTQGEAVAMNIVVTPEDTTDELIVTADNGASVVFDEETGMWVLDTAGVNVETGKEVIVTVTATAGDITESITITVKGILLGDSNANGIVTVADVVTTANYMVDSPVEVFCFPNANVMLVPTVDGKQAITSEDLSATINIVLDNFDGKREIRRYANRIFSNDRLVADNFNVVNDRPFTIGVNLDNSYEYSVLQAEIEIPEGMKAMSVEKGPRAAAHELTFNIKDDNTVKVVLYSLANESFINSEGSLFTLVVTADSNCGNLNIVNIYASDAVSKGYELSYDGGLNESLATGIDGLDADNADVHYFTVDGLEVVNPEKGQILIKATNGKTEKVIVK